MTCTALDDPKLYALENALAKQTLEIAAEWISRFVSFKDFEPEKFIDSILARAFDAVSNFVGRTRTAPEPESPTINAILNQSHLLLGVRSSLCG